MSKITTMGGIDTVHDLDLNASPVGSIDTNTTPDTEFSPPDSPFQPSGPPKDKRQLAKQKLATLTIEEKVRRDIHLLPLESSRRFKYQLTNVRSRFSPLRTFGGQNRSLPRISRQ